MEKSQKRVNQIVKVMLLASSLLLSWVLAKSLWQLYQAGGQLKQADTILKEAEAENARLKAELSRIDSDDFREKEVRDELNLQREGEMIVVLPINPVEVQLETRETKMAEKSNWQKWLELFLVAGSGD